MDTVYHYRADGGFAEAVQLCNGVGACLKMLTGTMCPSYMVTRDERHTPRGRANALRLAVTGQLGQEAMHCEELFDLLDLCISCKACKTECPSNVDVARLKGEFLQHYYDHHRFPLRNRLVAHAPCMAACCSGWSAPLLNAVQNAKLFRRVLDRYVGIDYRRVLPAYAREPFAQWFQTRQKHQTIPHSKALRKQVVLFPDSYMNYHEPHIGKAALDSLSHPGTTPSWRKPVVLNVPAFPWDGCVGLKKMD